MKNIAKAQAYYTLMGQKDVAGMEQYLHPDVQFFSPLAKLRGKEAVLDSAKGLTALFKTFTIRTAFGSDDQAVLILDMELPGTHSPSASLLSFKDGLISKIELFLDVSPFVKKRDELFDPQQRQ